MEGGYDSLSGKSSQVHIKQRVHLTASKTASGLVQACGMKCVHQNL